MSLSTICTLFSWDVLIALRCSVSVCRFGHYTRVEYLSTKNMKLFRLRDSTVRRTEIRTPTCFTIYYAKISLHMNVQQFLCECKHQYLVDQPLVLMQNTILRGIDAQSADRY